MRYNYGMITSLGMKNRNIEKNDDDKNHMRIANMPDQ